MSAEVDLRGSLDGCSDDLRPLAGTTVTDHLRELRIVKWWTRLIVYPGGTLSLVALTSLSRVDADRYLRVGASRVQCVLSSKKVVALCSDSDLLAEAILTPRQQVVFVPVQSFQRVVGIVGLVADSSTSELRDSELLASLGC